ncbi:MAG: TatD family hydrolase [Clostridium sp.]|nr:TatD family hydrolase [Clostridium sp.]
MIFDTHAHYDDEAFDQDRETLLAGLPGAGIARVVNIGADLASCRRTIALTERYPYIYGALGVHPSETGELDEASFAWLKGQCGLEKCVAVGEVGLDYHWKEADVRTQKNWFRRFLDLAKEARLPVVIHSRDAAQDTLEILRAAGAKDLGGVMHCYSYSKEMAKSLLEMGFFFGIGGVVTFQNAKKLREVVAYLPMDTLVLETDCPYLSPEPYRGKRNSSRNLPYVVRAVAEIKGIPEKEVERITWGNACKLYGMGEGGKNCILSTGDLCCAQSLQTLEGA